jgi:hypothetical protein
MRAKRVSFEFVEFVPDELELSTLYISIPYATIVHLCLCGCGERVVTPLAPADWRLTFDGDSVSLHPSVGNWSFDCQSHYWIERNKVRWGSPFSGEMIEAARERDQHATAAYYDQSSSGNEAEASTEAHRIAPPARWWQLWRGRPKRHGRRSHS